MTALSEGEPGVEVRICQWWGGAEAGEKSSSSGYCQGSWLETRHFPEYLLGQVWANVMLLKGTFQPTWVSRDFKKVRLQNKTIAVRLVFQDVAKLLWDVRRILGRWRCFWLSGLTSQPNYPLMSHTDAQLSTGTGPSSLGPAWPQNRIAQVGCSLLLSGSMTRRLGIFIWFLFLQCNCVNGMCFIHSYSCYTSTKLNW